MFALSALANLLAVLALRMGIARGVLVESVQGQ